MYRRRDRQALPLFAELFPFGGKLDPDNRWMKIADLIPWDDIETRYSTHFSDKGRPASDCRLVIGLLLLKHMTRFGDEAIIAFASESPYMQFFCGFDQFVTNEAKDGEKKSILDSSTLSKARKRLGEEFFAQLEQETYELLVELKLIKGKGMLVDATVFPEYIRYPTDTGLLNEAREWTVKQVKRLGKELGVTVRTYCRKARKEYLNFSKKKTKSRKLIRKATKSLLQYLRRNVKQMQTLMYEAGRQGVTIGKKVHDRFTVVRTVLDQQYEMYRRKASRIEDRIVSLHRPWTRPIVRGKSGDKKVEFGPKASLTYVDGFVFLDHMSSDNFNESARVEPQIEEYEQLFGHKPPYVTADKIYGNHENRNMLKERGIRDAFEPLGRKVRKQNPADRWRKQKQRERNRIEGSIGHMKNHFSLDKIKYYIEDGCEIWVRLGLLCMNLQTAVKKV